MAEVTFTTSNHRDTIARALTSYYQLLTEFPYLPEAALQIPPAEGWGDEHRVVFRQLGKSEGVVDVLSHIPYLTTDKFHINYDTSVIDWRSSRVRDAAQRRVSLQQASLEPMNQTIPENTISLTTGSNYGRWLLLDVDKGTITNYSLLGGPDPKSTDEENAAGISWKKHETKSAAELIGDWTEKLRSLTWIPIPSPTGDQGTIRTPITTEDPDQEQVRNIYRNHGWETANFQKEECRNALITWEEEFRRKQLEQYSNSKAENARRRRERAAAAAAAAVSST